MDNSFSDRLDAGAQLADALAEYRDSNAVVLGLARGGIVVGYAVSHALNLPLEALIVRKLGAPHNPELAIGAVSETGVRWLDQHLVEMTGADDDYIEAETTTQLAEAKRRQREYAREAPDLTVRDRPGIIVDDGIATGATTLVAIQSVRSLGAAEVILAAPVASPQATAQLRRQADRLVILATPDPFLAVGMHYQRFEQVSDEEVLDYLRHAREEKK